MADITEVTISQGTYETRKWTVDFTNDLPSGATVSSGTAYHTPPSGSAGTPTIDTSGSTVTAQLTGLSVLGNHYLDVVATYSNAEVSQQRIAFVVNYPSTTARSGMLDLITELRGMTEAGAADYKVGGVPYWSDVQMQDILDLHRNDVIFEQLEIFPNQVAGGSISYLDYRSHYDFYEASTGGTAIFYVQDSTGSAIGSSTYTPDYRRGIVLFGSDQAGTVYYLTGRSYDLQAAAADVWRRKAAHYAVSSFDFSTDNHSIKRSQVYEHCLAMAEFYEAKSGDAMMVVSMFRGDVD